MADETKPNLLTRDGYYKLTAALAKALGSTDMLAEAYPDLIAIGAKIDDSDEIKLSDAELEIVEDARRASTLNVDTKQKVDVSDIMEGTKKAGGLYSPAKPPEAGEKSKVLDDDGKTPKQRAQEARQGIPSAPTDLMREVQHVAKELHKAKYASSKYTELGKQYPGAIKLYSQLLHKKGKNKEWIQQVRDSVNTDGSFVASEAADEYFKNPKRYSGTGKGLDDHLEETRAPEPKPEEKKPAIAKKKKAKSKSGDGVKAILKGVGAETKEEGKKKPKIAKKKKAKSAPKGEPAPEPAPTPEPEVPPDDHVIPDEDVKRTVEPGEADAKRTAIAKGKEGKKGSGRLWKGAGIGGALYGTAQLLKGGEDGPKGYVDTAAPLEYTPFEAASFPYDELKSYGSEHVDAARQRLLSLLDRETPVLEERAFPEYKEPPQPTSRDDVLMSMILGGGSGLLNGPVDVGEALLYAALGALGGLHQTRQADKRAQSAYEEGLYQHNRDAHTAGSEFDYRKASHDLAAEGERRRAFEGYGDFELDHFGDRLAALTSAWNAELQGRNYAEAENRRLAQGIERLNYERALEPVLPGPEHAMQLYEQWIEAGGKGSFADFQQALQWLPSETGRGFEVDLPPIGESEPGITSAVSSFLGDPLEAASFPYTRSLWNTAFSGADPIESLTLPQTREYLGSLIPDIPDIPDMPDRYQPTIQGGFGQHSFQPQALDGTPLNSLAPVPPGSVPPLPLGALPPIQLDSVPPLPPSEQLPLPDVTVTLPPGQLEPPPPTTIIPPGSRPRPPNDVQPPTVNAPWYNPQPQQGDIQNLVPQPVPGTTPAPNTFDWVNQLGGSPPSDPARFPQGEDRATALPSPTQEQLLSTMPLPERRPFPQVLPPPGRSHLVPGGVDEAAPATRLWDIGAGPYLQARPHWALQPEHGPEGLGVQGLRYPWHTGR